MRGQAGFMQNRYDSGSVSASSRFQTKPVYFHLPEGGEARLKTWILAHCVILPVRTPAGNGKGTGRGRSLLKINLQNTRANILK